RETNISAELSSGRLRRIFGALSCQADADNRFFRLIPGLTVPVLQHLGSNPAPLGQPKPPHSQKGWKGSIQVIPE
ncbi:MAG: hypothetical protein OSB05_16500, partial [Akkermansiaceae bacterium]|nr:hypothetical protein [Akkermansiaceae bacterium]